MDNKYNVIFNGKILPEFNSQVAQENAIRHLKVPESQIAAFFSGKSITLSRDMTLDEATKLCVRLGKMGLSAQALPMSASSKKDWGLESVRPEFKGKYDYDTYEPLSPIPKTFAIELQGRLARISYLNAQLFLFLALLPFGVIYGIIWMFQIEMLMLITILAAAAFYIFFGYRIVILRLHDLNMSGWLVLIFFLERVPNYGWIIVSLFSLFLICMPGTKGENAYGAPPEEGTKLGLLAFVILVPALICLGIYLEYQDRLVQKSVAESLKQIEVIEEGLQDFYTKSETFPKFINEVPNWQHALAGNEVIDQINLKEGGRIQIIFNDLVKSDAFIEIQPMIYEDYIMWRCADSDLPIEWIPVQCLLEIERVKTLSHP